LAESASLSPRKIHRFRVVRPMLAVTYEVA